MASFRRKSISRTSPINVKKRCVRLRRDHIASLSTYTNFPDTSSRPGKKQPDFPVFSPKSTTTSGKEEAQKGKALWRRPLDYGYGCPQISVAHSSPFAVGGSVPTYHAAPKPSPPLSCFWIRPLRPMSARTRIPRGSERRLFLVPIRQS